MIEYVLSSEGYPDKTDKTPVPADICKLDLRNLTNKTKATVICSSQPTQTVYQWYLGPLEEEQCESGKQSKLVQDEVQWQTDSFLKGLYFSFIQ